MKWLWGNKAKSKWRYPIQQESGAVQRWWTKLMRMSSGAQTNGVWMLMISPEGRSGVEGDGLQKRERPETQTRGDKRFSTRDSGRCKRQTWLWCWSERGLQQADMWRKASVTKERVTLNYVGCNYENLPWPFSSPVCSFLSHLKRGQEALELLRIGWKWKCLFSN